MGYMNDLSASQIDLENNVLSILVFEEENVCTIFMNRLNSYENNLIKHILATSLIYHSTFCKEWCTTMLSSCFITLNIIL